MTYTGLVLPGGPTDARRLANLTIRKMSVSAMHNNVYLLTCHATGAQLLIDAADDVARCVELVDEGTGQLDEIVTTHCHWDHVRALPDLVSATGARTSAGAPDASGLPIPPDRRLTHGDRIQVGEISLEVALISGHTAGSVALTYRDPEGTSHIFVGDTLFPGGLGATSNDPSQSFESLFADVTARIFATHDDLSWVYPGHGADTTLGRERPHLDSWRERGW